MVLEFHPSDLKTKPCLKCKPCLAKYSFSTFQKFNPEYRRTFKDILELGFQVMAVRAIAVILIVIRSKLLLAQLLALLTGQTSLKVRVPLQKGSVQGSQHLHC